VFRLYVRFSVVVWFGVVLVATACSTDSQSAATDGGSETTPRFDPTVTVVNVPAGTFMMGCNAAIDDQCDPDESPSHMVELDAFAIDVDEITVSQYQGCIDGGGCDAPLGTWPACNFGRTGRESHPINCVGWVQAKSYCEWSGGRLLTEAEWEKAARGTDGRIYPWGNDVPTCDHANHTHCGQDSAPVGTRDAGRSPYGARDMAGNVIEWVADYYGEEYYAESPASNPTGPSSSSERSARGGSYFGFPRYIRASIRHPYLEQDVPVELLGIRCGRALVP
jgi:formylglycine-generating enzyme required for sulfatase activity